MDGRSLAISGFDHVVALNGSDLTRVVIGTDSAVVIYDSSATTIVLRQGADTLLSFGLRPLVDTLLGMEPSLRGAVPLRVVSEGTAVRGMLVLAWMGGDRKEGRGRLTGWRGDLYLDLRGECLGRGPC